MRYFLWVILILFIGEFLYILLWQKEKPIPEQVVIKARNGKRTIVILRNK
jgi:hypothetical protein